jgi:hypothetical protein
VATGARKDKVAGQFAFTKAGIGRYIVTKEDDLIFVYDARGVNRMVLLKEHTHRIS